MRQVEADPASLPRMPPAPEYRIVTYLLGPAVRVIFDFGVVGEEHVPGSGPVLLAAVHRSNSDVPFLGVACCRPVNFMAKRELFELPVLGSWFRRLGAFPVDRDRVDKAALVGAEAVLSRGGVLGMFPEGSIGRGRSVGQLQRGAAWLARRARATLVPVGVGGSERVLPVGGRLPRSARVRIVFGPPFDLPDRGGRGAVDRATQDLRCAMQDVQDRANSLIRR
ncbi:MAG: 1-acyl-sn-glycerol-3-phosphate acyltransferase [Actinobacteria bacterium ATB1]|nr:1-acyl-sn-glycerol-3-phosphate acyltransferase [Actinobacteria bacterium ATB1]